MKLNEGLELKHFVYEIKNNLNKKKYIGKHSGKFEDILFTYFGSSIHLRNAIKKYGVHNFSYSILAEASSEDKAYMIEKKLTLEFDVANNKNFYNMKPGGKGNSKGTHFSEETKKKISKNHHDVSGSNNPMYGKKHSKKVVDFLKKNTTRWINEKGHPWIGRTHTESAKEKIRQARKKQVGEKDPSFKGYWHTPNGIFITSKKAAQANSCCRQTIYHRVNNFKFSDYYMEHIKWC